MKINEGYMDSNNGVVIQGVPAAVANYSAWVDAQKADQIGERPAFVEKTAEMAVLADRMSAVTGADDKAIDGSRREVLRAVYGAELTKVAQHFEKKWRAKVESAPEAARAKVEEKIANLRRRLPGMVGGGVERQSLYLENFRRPGLSRDGSGEEGRADSRL